MKDLEAYGHASAQCKYSAYTMHVHWIIVTTKRSFNIVNLPGLKKINIYYLIQYEIFHLRHTKIIFSSVNQ